MSEVNLRAPEEMVDYTKELITLEDAKLIANRHNEFLSEIFDNFDYTSSNLEVELENKIKESLKPERFESQFMQQAFDFDYEAEYSELSNDKLRDIIDKTRSILIESQNVMEINEQIDLLYSNSKNNLSSIEERNFAMTYLEVTKASASFWYDSSKGGTGEGESILVKLAEGGGRTVSCVDSVIAADGMEAGSSLIIGAITAGLAGGPIGAGAFFGLVGIRAAVASGSAALIGC